MFRDLDAGRTESSAAAFAESGLNHGVEVTREMVELVHRSLHQAMPDAVTEVVDLIAVDDVVVCRTSVTGTHLGVPDLPFVEGGVFAGIAPSGISVSTTRMHWMRLRDGQIIEHWANRDDLGLARQLGLL